ncbi:hypothetical protein [Vallitalea okinawensis]|uniref:hypothetical protein n=1 Tax=Vallitalea okinawensis TaxID=2078660 RepID=UPI000CFD4DA8|nr:hypothetical protein [Vallitalea okinawensis]
MKTTDEMITTILTTPLSEQQNELIIDFLKENDFNCLEDLESCLETVPDPDLTQLYNELFMNEEEEIVQDEW